MTITPETWVSIGLTLFSIVVGGGVTWLAAHKYYVRAAKEMEAESKKLRNLHRISLQAMENAGMVDLTRDQNGDISGMVQAFSCNIVATSHVTAELTCDDEVHER